MARVEQEWKDVHYLTKGSKLDDADEDVYMYWRENEGVMGYLMGRTQRIME